MTQYSTGISNMQWVFGLVLAVTAVVLPFNLSNYHVFQMAMVLSYAIALVGLNILTGYSGQISLGHGAFLAIGAYTTAILIDKYDMHYALTIPLAALICFVAGFLFGLPALRLEGHYLALATFSLAVALPQLLKFKHLEEWTGGVQGIVIMKPESPLKEIMGLQINADRWMYFVSLFIAIVMFILARNILKGRVGRALIAIRDHPIAASSMGINTSLYKSLAFGVSALFTGVAGSLSALLISFVAPDSFNVFLSIILLVGMVIGGAATLSGALWGALFIQFIPNLADEISKAAPWAIYGVSMIAFIYLMPMGIAGALALLGKRLTRH
jgi:branched-chain amino acid transport system permease protein